MQINTSREIGILVRERRRATGISQHALAALVGASRQWVQKLEAGKPGIELGLTLRALASLGIRLDARSVAEPVRIDVIRKSPIYRALAERQSRAAPEPTGGLTWQAPWERAEVQRKRTVSLPPIDINAIVAPASPLPKRKK